MLPVTSREYKVMLDHRMFAQRMDALGELQRDLQRLAKRIQLAIEGKWSKPKKRSIRFLDTCDGAVNANNFILRYRRKPGADEPGELTLKCRIEDRYLAAGASIYARDRLDGETKFEEDIAAPFRSRFSHSQTVDNPAATPPATIGEAAEIFPALGNLRRDGRICSAATPLETVGGLVPRERVYKGVDFFLASGVRASAAVILWSASWKGRVNFAEFSFRYGSETEDYEAATARQAYDLFAAIQRLDWCLPDGRTKTQFAYGG